MTTPRNLAALLGISACLLMAERAHAVVLASDDFSSATSGVGWAAGNVWEGLAGGVVTTDPAPGANVTSFRDFATPIDATQQVTFIRFDYAQTVPGNGGDWGGIALFEGVEGSPAEETLFAGNPGPASDYGLDIKGGPTPIFGSGVPFDSQFHSIIMRIDATGPSHTYDLWVDNVIQGAPNASTTFTGGGAVNAPWNTLRVAGHDPNTDVVDNLVIATEPADVGLVPSNITLSINRTTGAAAFTAASGFSNNIVGYTLQSGAGALSAGDWTPIAAGNSQWTVGSQTSAELAESTSGAGGPFVLPVNLGSLWERSALEDVRGFVTLGGGSRPLQHVVNVVYTGPAVAAGDLDADGDVDVTDWSRFKSGQGVVDDSLSRLAAYRLGDLDGNLDHNLDDFNLFAAAYDVANGAGAFTAMIEGVPEPAALSLAVLGGLAVCLRRRTRRRGALLLAVAAIAMIGLAPSSAHAVVFAEDDFSAEGSGSGWAAGDTWGIVAGGVAKYQSTYGFRNLATPLEPFSQDVIYIAFDIQIPSGDATQWAGVAFFEGQDGAGDENLFIGDLGGHSAYAVDMKGGAGNLPIDPQAEGVPIDAGYHRMILAIDFDNVSSAPPFNDIYRLWIDNFNPATPNYETVIAPPAPPIDAAWQSVRIAGGVPLNVDDLIITDEPAKAFAINDLQLVVNKSTGDISIANNTGAAVAMSAYSIASSSGMLNVGTLPGDFNRDAVVDGQDFLVWQRGESPTFLSADDLADWKANYGDTGGAGGWLSLQEQNRPGFPAGNGAGNGWEQGGAPSATELEEYFLTGASAIASGGAPVSLGAAYGGGAAGAQDLVFRYRQNGQIKTGLVSYVANPVAAAIPEPAGLSLGLVAAAGLLRLARRRAASSR